ncbi:MAG: hypothetical protein WAM60_13085 [Candidatus Promineifilaceae bacterium]
MKQRKDVLYVLIGLVVLFLPLFVLLANGGNSSLGQPIPTATPFHAPIKVILSKSNCHYLPEGAFSMVDPQPGCPSTTHPRILPEAWLVEITYQSFEGGAMMRVSQAGTYPVQRYVFYLDSRYQTYYPSGQEDFDAPPLSGIGESPPDGRSLPAEGFRKIWLEEPGVRDRLGWATAEAITTDGRFQSFLTSDAKNGGMIWINQRQEIYTLQGETYQISSSPTFALPTSAPPKNAASLILGRWKDSRLPGSPTFEFSEDGAILFKDCTGNYELVEGGKIRIDAGECESPELPAGLYEYTFNSGLTLSQRFQLDTVLFAGFTWRQEDNDYEIEVSAAGIKILGDDCYGVIEPTEGTATTINWSDCQIGERKLASALYKFTYVGQELFLTRRFEKADTP